MDVNNCPTPGTPFQAPIITPRHDQVFVVLAFEKYRAPDRLVWHTGEKDDPVDLAFQGTYWAIKANPGEKARYAIWHREDP